MWQSLWQHCGGVFRFNADMLLLASRAGSKLHMAGVGNRVIPAGDFVLVSQEIHLQLLNYNMYLWSR